METVLLYCQDCEKWVPCGRSKEPTDLQTWPISGDPHKEHEKWKDIWWYERVRICPDRHDMKTAEISIRLLHEFFELRNLLEARAPSIEAIAKESRKICEKAERAQQDDR